MTAFVTNISSIMEKFTPARGSTKLDQHEHDNDNTTTNATMAGRSSARSTKMLPSPSATPSSAAAKSASKTKPARQSSAAKPKGRPRTIASTTKVTTTTKSKPAIPQTSTATRPRRTAAAPTRYTPPTFHAPASRSRRGYHKITAILEEDPTDYFVQWAGVDPRTKEEWLPEWVPKKAVTAAAVEEWRAETARREGKKARRGKREEVKAKKGKKVKKAQ